MGRDPERRRSLIYVARFETDDPLDIGDVGVADGMHAWARCLALDTRMTDCMAARLLRTLAEGEEFILKIKFLRERDEGDRVVEEKFDPVREEEGAGHRRDIQNNSLGMLTGIDKERSRTHTLLPRLCMASILSRDPDTANPAADE